MSEEDRILRALEKLDRLRRMGLIDEEYYREKRDILLSKYLEVSSEKPETLEEHLQTQYGEGRRLTSILPIVLLVIAAILIGMVVGNITHPFVKVPTYTTTLIIEKPTTITREYWYTVTETQILPEIISPPPSMSYNQALVYGGLSSIPTERIVYSGSLYLEKDCRGESFSINAKKGDVIKVYWESNDDDTYVAIGTDADLEKNRNTYCEFLVAGWKWSWPEADYGYSGHLEFNVPSSATWYVIVMNGNWGCIYSECPITITKLEIKHVEVS